MAGQESHQVHGSIFRRNLGSLRQFKTDFFGQYGIDRSGQVSIVSANTKTGSACNAQCIFYLFYTSNIRNHLLCRTLRGLVGNLTGEQGRPVKNRHIDIALFEGFAGFSQIHLGNLLDQGVAECASDCTGSNVWLNGLVHYVGDHSRATRKA